ncbi:MAG: sigma-70 family RNA polymerase sigma factor [Fimbriimonadales bacterium]|nr:sigma-70 family RNA polymerase sigma factor [Fimbriimonadales bacterium]
MVETTLHSAEKERRFESLMRQTYKKVYNLALRLSGNIQDAEDLTQEAFYRAYRAFDTYDGTKPFENWILKIVSRLYLDLLRYRSRRVQTVSYDYPLRNQETEEEEVYFEKPDETTNPERQILNEVFSEGLEYALQSLKPEQRMLVLLADVEGIPYQEISEIMGAPVGTIRSRLHRAHKALRARLAEWERNHPEHVANLRLCQAC